MNQGSLTPRLRRLAWNVLRLGVTVGAIAYVLSQITWHDRLIDHGTVIEGWLHVDNGIRTLVTRTGQVVAVPPDAEQADAEVRLVPGIITIFSRVKFGYFLEGTLLVATSVFLGAIRWQWLLQSHDLDPGLREATRLTWMGYLSNNILPGATGGDLVKAYTIARRTPGKRTSAVMTVLLDRVIGLLALIILGALGVAIKATRDGIDSTGRLVLTMLAIAVVGGIVFFSRRIRIIFRISAFFDRIPMGHHFKRIDDSLFHYRDHKMQLARCVGIGLFIWLLTIGGIYLMGESISMSVPFVDYFICLPVIFSAGAVAPSIAGLGVLEGLFQHFFGAVGAAPSTAVALCLLYRLAILIVSIPGAYPLYQEFSSGRPQVVPSLDDEGDEGHSLAKNRQVEVLV
ncbi:flippase-like domain-containing protein [bacterium]|nr:flippase-like domain-containing protein [bacterium]